MQFQQPSQQAVRIWVSSERCVLTTTEASAKQKQPDPRSVELLKETEVGGEFLRSNAVMHGQRKVRGGLDVPFIEANDLNDDVRESLACLQALIT